MAILKCKMCGGDIEVHEDMSIGTCLYCGSTMTIPRIDTDKKARLFNRANLYRLNNEFDKAYDAYKAIVEEDEQEAEAYWGMILSEYGVEYVEDPKTKKRIPTCHRTCIQAVQNSTNFMLACKYADAESKFMYQDEAEVLDQLQKKIIAISAKEEPYDVFICYKETDDVTGERTQDSVLAQEIYQELNKQGIRTFFARISLEDKLGQNYEPYIFAALQSAKVMLQVSTKSEHSNSIWVKNEWKRYIDFMSEDDSKTLIPVYRDMSPYEFPAELCRYQAQDMGKVGAIQDLVYGVQKLCGTVRQAGGGLKAEERALLHQLEEDREKTQKKNILKRQLLTIICACVTAFFGFIVISANEAVWSQLGRNHSLEYVYLYYRKTGVIACAVIGSAFFIHLMGIVINIKKGIKDQKSYFMHMIGFVLLSLFNYYMFAIGFKMQILMWMIYLISFLALLITEFAALLKKENKKLCVLLIVTLVLVAGNITLSVMPYKDKESNPRDESVTQVKVLTEYLNVREEPDITSFKKGIVYQGQIFTVLSFENSRKFYWFEIETESGLHGYIATQKDKKNNETEQYLEILEMEGMIDNYYYIEYPEESNY